MQTADPSHQRLCRKPFSRGFFNPSAAKPSRHARYRQQPSESLPAGGERNALEAPPSYRFGDYELIEKIGQGGMGVIYKARQQTLNRIVAVKMIRAGKLAAPVDIQRFQSEAEAIGRLEHPQIVPIYELDQVDGVHFVSMAFVDGEDLAPKLQTGPLPQEISSRFKSTESFHESGGQNLGISRLGYNRMVHRQGCRSIPSGKKSLTQKECCWQHRETPWGLTSYLSKDRRSFLVPCPSFRAACPTASAGTC